MVKVSRDTGEPSVFRIVVVVGAESIAQTSKRSGKTERYHFTPKGRMAEMGVARTGKCRKRKGMIGRGVQTDPRCDGAGVPLDTSRYNEYYAGLAPVLPGVEKPGLPLPAPGCSNEELHDYHSQEQRTRPRRPRLAEHPIHFFFRRLLRPQA